MDSKSRFRERVRLYRDAGISVESLSLGCSVKVDLYDVLYPALKLLSDEVKKLNLVIAPREDVAVLRGDDVDMLRVITSVEDPRIDPGTVEGFAPHAVVILAQVYQGKAGDPNAFAESVAKLYKALGSTKHRVWIGKGHSIISTKSDAELFLVDMLRSKGGEGYVLANNDTIQVIDVSEDPTSFRQVAIAISNALNDLFSKGAYKNIKIAPVYDAPQRFLEDLEKAVMEFSSKMGKVVDVPQPRRGYLLVGATVSAYLDKEPPMFYNYMEGQSIIVTRPFGELSIFTTYVALHTDDFLMERFEKEVMSIEDFEKIKDSVLNMMATPNVDIAKIIYRYLPELGETYRPDEHISATTDISGPGIFVFKELAEQAGMDIELYDIPLVEPRIAEFATKNYVMLDSTAGTNGAVAIVAPQNIAEEIVSELSRIPQLKPMVIGRVKGRGAGKLVVPESIQRYVASNRLREKLGVASVLGGVSRRGDDMASAVVKVGGTVQGVGFRPRLRARALSLGLTGYARNMPDGTVEVFVEGSRDKVRQFVEEICMGVEDCRTLSVSWGECTGHWKDFVIG